MTATRPSANRETGEPLRRGARVRDRDGDVWRRGNTRWTCQSPIDGVRIRAVGRLPWFTLKDWYGPLTVVDLNDGKQP